MGFAPPAMGARRNFRGGGGGQALKKTPLKTKKAPPPKKKILCYHRSYGARRHAPQRKFQQWCSLRHFRCISAGAYLGFHFLGGGGQINFRKLGYLHGAKRHAARGKGTHLLGGSGACSPEKIFTFS